MRHGMQFTIRQVPVQGELTLAIVDEDGIAYGGVPADQDGAMDELGKLRRSIVKAFDAGVEDMRAGASRDFTVVRKRRQFLIMDDRREDYGGMDAGLLSMNRDEANTMRDVMSFAYDRGREYALDHGLVRRSFG